MNNFSGSLRIISLNARSLNNNKFAQLRIILDTLAVDIACIQETHWIDTCKINCKGYLLFNSGETEKNWCGVCILIKKNLSGYISKFDGVNSRVCSIKVNMRCKTLNIVNIYIPVNYTEKQPFFIFLDEYLNKFPKRENLLIAGDFNAKVGKIDIKNHISLGSGTLNIKSDIGGKLLLKLCHKLDLRIANTFFEHSDKREIYTYFSPTYNTWSQIDYFICNRSTMSWIKNIKVLHQVLFNSDHKIIDCSMVIDPKIWHMKKKRNGKSLSKRPKLDIEALNDHNIKTEYIKQIRNNSHKFIDHTNNLSSDTLWENTRDIFNNAASNSLPAKMNYPDWISIESKNLISNLVGSGHYRRNRAMYILNDISHKLRRDKRKFLEDRATEISNSFSANDSYKAFKLLKSFTSFKKEQFFKLSHNSKEITDPEIQMEIWVSHYSKIFNSNEPSSTSNNCNDPSSTSNNQIVISPIDQSPSTSKSPIDQNASSSNSWPPQVQLLQNPPKWPSDLCPQNSSSYNLLPSKLLHLPNQSESCIHHGPSTSYLWPPQLFLPQDNTHNTTSLSTHSSLSTLFQNTDRIIDPIKSEIINIIKKLKNHKACGQDNIRSEYLKTDPILSADILFPIISRVWKEGICPSDWLSATLINFPKTKYPKTLEDWRGISLNSIIYKIFTNIILNRLKPFIERDYVDSIVSFRKGHNALEAILNLKIQIEKSIIRKRQLIIIALDFRKAFDTIIHDRLWIALEEVNTPTSLVKILKNIYNDYSIQIIHAGHKSTKIPVKIGLKQGCVLSPLLFNFITNYIIKRVTKQCLAQIPIVKFNILAFADDICIIGDSISHLQLLVDMMTQVADFFGLKINIDKTKLMTSIFSPPNMNLTIQVRKIAEVQQLKYLGVILNRKGNTKLDLIAKINKGRLKYRSFMKIWSSNQLSIPLKIRLFKTLIFPSLIYGIETWKDTKQESKKMQTFINKCLRYITKTFYPYNTSNHNLWSRCDILPIYRPCEYRKIEILGHILRQAPNNLVYQALFITPLEELSLKPFLSYKNSWFGRINRSLSDIDLSWEFIKRASLDRKTYKIVLRLIYEHLTNNC
ncbi:uncharacterized protein LOC135927702 [Gordionus sp. m RMFG-2023]|uniref:uncharacterized protein LOC135927702 n=1 Tax=Gordionus sp. m RMFG-2023 TaxID=3053472 RepID=UPI0031FE341C